MARRERLAGDGFRVGPFSRENRLAQKANSLVCYRERIRWREPNGVTHPLAPRPISHWFIGGYFALTRAAGWRFLPSSRLRQRSGQPQRKQLSAASKWRRAGRRRRAKPRRRSVTPAAIQILVPAGSPIIRPEPRPRYAERSLPRSQKCAAPPWLA